MCICIYIYNIVVSVTYFIYHTTRRPSFLGQLQTTPMRGKRLLGTEMKEIGFAWESLQNWLCLSSSFTQKTQQVLIGKTIFPQVGMGQPIVKPATCWWSIPMISHEFPGKFYVSPYQVPPAGEWQRHSLAHWQLGGWHPGLKLEKTWSSRDFPRLLNDFK